MCKKLDNFYDLSKDFYYIFYFYYTVKILKLCKTQKLSEIDKSSKRRYFLLKLFPFI